jgi:hypothetical protein
MLSWWRKSGMRKAEFFRAALMMGVVQLANNLEAKSPDEGYYNKRSERYEVD